MTQEPCQLRAASRIRGRARECPVNQAFAQSLQKARAIAGNFLPARRKFLRRRWLAPRPARGVARTLSARTPIECAACVVAARVGVHHAGAHVVVRRLHHSGRTRCGLARRLVPFVRKAFFRPCRTCRATRRVRGLYLGGRASFGGSGHTRLRQRTCPDRRGERARGLRQASGRARQCADAAGSRRRPRCRRLSASRAAATWRPIAAPMSNTCVE